MIIFKDIITGDELFTDSFNIIRRDGIIEVNCKMVSESTEIDESLIGGNASAEEASEGVESAEKKGYDVVIQNRLAEQPPFDKKGFMAHIKPYLKAVKGKMKENGRSEEDMKKFEDNMSAHVKSMVKKGIDKMEVFSGEKMDPDGMQVLVDFRDDEITPFAMFIAEGLIEEKA
ncbi:uncharacterized protein [Watersipora subatra]|uniref:uncharacterized protein n=1 Tax=Watersipora subatra TaxID=2589382 RepID=UPI00355B4D8F